VRENYSWESVVARFEEILEKYRAVPRKEVVLPSKNDSPQGTASTAAGQLRDVVPSAPLFRYQRPFTLAD